MSEINMYKYAAINKLRFPFTKGLVTLEDLFDLSVENLDSIYKALRKQAKVEDEESLLATKSKESSELQIKIDIVKDIVTDKQNALAARKAAAEKKAQNQKIAEIIARKENAELENKSIDELKAMLSED